MSSSTLLQSATIMFCALALSACAGASCPVQPLTDSARALRVHRSLQRTITAIRGEARVDQRGTEGRVRGTVLIYLERPDHIRFDAMTQFGPAAILTSDGENFQLLDMRENRFFVGPATPSNISRLLGVALSGEEVARLLVGDTPRLAGAEYSIVCTNDGYLLEGTGPEGKRHVVLLAARDGDENAAPAEQHLRLMRSELFNAEGETLWRATFADYEVIRDPADAEGRGVALPMTIHFEDPIRDADALIRFKSIEITTERPGAEVFHQDAPPGIRVEQIGG